MLPQTISLIYKMGAGATGMAAASNLLPLLQQTTTPVPKAFGLSEAIGGALLVLCVYLFRVSREQDKLGAELRARTERAERDIEKLQAAERTVDARIMESRHLQDNRYTELIGNLENRLTEWLDKLEEKLDRRGWGPGRSSGNPPAGGTPT